MKKTDLLLIIIFVLLLISLAVTITNYLSSPSTITHISNGNVVQAPLNKVIFPTYGSYTCKVRFDEVLFHRNPYRLPEKYTTWDCLFKGFTLELNDDILLEKK